MAKKTYLNPNAFKDGSVNAEKLNNESVSKNFAIKDHGHGSITLTGDVTGTASFTKDGASITTTVGNDSHAHTVSTITDFTASVDDRINAKVAANDAMVFKGTIGTSGTITALPTTHEVGWTYKVSSAGTYAGQNCEVGDLILCTTDGTSANDAHWTVVQTNNDGCVSGPASATSGNFAAFDGATGKLIKDSGYNSNSFQPAGSYAAASHTHDDRYYTESEIDAKLAGKSNTGHTHDYAPSNHSHSNYSSTGHNHDTVYSKTGHTHDYAPSSHSHSNYSLTSHTHSNYSTTGHTHNYAGSSSAGGSATSAVKLDTTTAGSTTQPCYFANGKPSACTYTLGKNVPSDAVFTDTWRPVYNGVDSTSTSSGATANAVKTAYDKAVSAYNTATGKTSNTGTVTKVSTGKGLTGGDITSSGTIKCNLNSETSLGTIGSTSKLYAVGVDANNKLCVNVPWTDTNTVYTHPTSSGNKHIPSGGSSGQFLGWSADGTAKWVANPNTDTNTWRTVQCNGTSIGDNTLNLIAGTNVSLSRSNGSITISSTDTNTVYTHPTSSGNKHIPSGGSSGQFLGWSADGTAKWVANPNTDTDTKNTAGGSNTTSTIYPVGVTSQASYAQTYTPAGVTIQSGTKVYASGGFFQSSDETLKDFHGDIKVNFEELKKIPKVYYSWKYDDSAKRYIGTSAQKVQEIYPELVEVDNESNKLSVDYPKFTMINMKAIDMLYEENKSLKGELNDVKAELQMIKEKLGL